MSESSKRKLLVLGANGMLGNAVLRWFAQDSSFEIFGSVRNPEARALLQLRAPSARLMPGLELETDQGLAALFADVRPDLVINCIGVVKQLAGADDPLVAIPINAILPHRIARHCLRSGARLIHIGTDCVFSGKRGGYIEDDVPDAVDLYGRSKLMGEVFQEHTITLRTSIIGHELSSAHGLLGWFLAQSSAARGFSKAVFSALPTVELARLIQEFVIPNPQLHGTYHVSAAPINKYELLRMIARRYGRDLELTADDQLVVDRSLNSDRFRAATGYASPDWPDLIERMHAFG
jgi:dTDP-4-dehydrorhamnose reductase